VVPDDSDSRRTSKGPVVRQPEETIFSYFRIKYSVI